jgi:hypothetical protein
LIERIDNIGEPAMEPEPDVDADQPDPRSQSALGRLGWAPGHKIGRW